MSDVTELILGALAVVLCGAAIAVAVQVIREAWLGAFDAAHPEPPRDREGAHDGP